MGAALRDGVAGDDDRALGLRQHLGGARHRVSIATHPRRYAGRLQQVDIGVVFQNVAGQRQKYRTGRRRQRGLDRAVHVERQVLRAMHLRRPFDERPCQRREVGGEHRLGGDIFEVLLPGGDQHRRVGLHGVVQHAHGVAEPGRDVQVEHRELAGGLRVAVGHRHQRRLLQAEDVADVVLDREGIHQRQFGGARIAEHHLDALLLEQIEEGAFSGHYGQGIPPWDRGSCLLTNTAFLKVDHAHDHSATGVERQILEAPAAIEGANLVVDRVCDDAEAADFPRCSQCRP